MIAPKHNTGAWTGKRRYSFGTGTDGAAPVDRVVLDSSGNLYGTTSAGGTAGDGTVFQLQPGTSWQENILHSFLNADDGNTPYAGLVADSSGNFYGAATAGGVNGGGTIFELTQSGGTSTYNLLYDFTGGGDGLYSMSNLVRNDGKLYGTTIGGGANGNGTVYAFTP